MSWMVSESPLYEGQIDLARGEGWDFLGSAILDLMPWQSMTLTYDGDGGEDEE